jgi:RNA polymerase sigma factor (sigma-70 family)
MKAAVDQRGEPAVSLDPNERAIFQGLYQEHFKAIYAYVLRRVGSTDAPDLVADVFATAWRRIVDIPSPPESKLWLYGVARRVVSQHFRTGTRRRRLDAKLARTARWETAGDPGDYSDLDIGVLRLIERLKDDDQELVTLIVWDGLSHAEVATILNCSTNAVTIRWHRALKRLRNEIGALPGKPIHRSNPILFDPLPEEL